MIRQSNDEAFCPIIEKIVQTNCCCRVLFIESLWSVQGWNHSAFSFLLWTMEGSRVLGAVCVEEGNSLWEGGQSVSEVVSWRAVYVEGESICSSYFSTTAPDNTRIIWWPEFTPLQFCSLVLAVWTFNTKVCSLLLSSAYTFPPHPSSCIQYTLYPRNHPSSYCALYCSPHCHPHIH